MIFIDQYSVSTIPITMIFESMELSIGTAFIWKEGNSNFLITNWHNLSGRDPNTGKHISSTAAEPNYIKGYFNETDSLGSKIEVKFPIRDNEKRPLWWVHPRFGKQVDVVALPIIPPPGIDPYPINLLDSDDLEINVGMDVYILGYPFGIGAAGLPVWKRGSLATEPNVLEPIPRILIDTASRPGMSGSPIIRRSWSVHQHNGNNVTMRSGPATRFFGIYSGRLTANNPLDAQLGLAWPAHLIPEIIAGRQVDLW